MIRLFAFSFLLVTATLWQRPAEASGDFGCEPSWQLTHRDLSGCDNMAMLAPGNDTRVNLQLLMLDLRGKPLQSPAGGDAPDPFAEWPTFADSFTPTVVQEPEPEDEYGTGEGSRCRSNESGAAAFVAVVNAATVIPETERTALISARQGLQPDCAAPGAGGAALTELLQPVQSPLGKSFGAYLQGAQAFYDADYDAARMRFSSLHAVDQPWLAETARYMLGRVEVNSAQIDAFDEYGYPKETPADAKVIDAADAALLDYLSAYPQGAYAASARGLLRRVYWLGKRSDALAGSYKEMLATDPAGRGRLSDVDLLDEIDNKLLTASGFAAPNEPILLAIEDLRRMRGGEGSAPFIRSEIGDQRAAFASNPALHDYLLAAHDFYVDGNFGGVLAAIPEATPQAPLSYLDFSRQMLRGMALEAQKDAGARDHWLALLAAATQPLQRPAVELALALHDERAGALDKVFAADSKITNPSIREILLRNVADADLLRRQAKDTAVPLHERDIALYTLLYKEVTRGHYADFVKDVAQVRDDAPTEGYTGGLSTTEPVPLGVFIETTTLGDYGCGPLKETAAKLVKNPKGPKAQLCLADFMRANGFDQNTLDAQPGAEELGGTPSLFNGGHYARLDVYRSLIDSTKTPPEDKAYALYRAVRCYAPAQINSCGGADVPQSQRKTWFQQLKKRYPNSRWAKELQSYW